jgi:hypothetical protein
MNSDEIQCGYYATEGHPKLTLCANKRTTGLGMWNLVQGQIIHISTNSTLNTVYKVNDQEHGDSQITSAICEEFWQAEVDKHDIWSCVYSILLVCLWNLFPMDHSECEGSETTHEETVCSGMDNTSAINLNSDLHYSINYFYCIITNILIMCKQYISQSLILRPFNGRKKIL